MFVLPTRRIPPALARVVAADEAGLNVLGVQDHPYQRRFFDTWTLLSFAGARTQRIRRRSNCPAGGTTASSSMPKFAHGHKSRIDGPIYQGCVRSKLA
ncbi:MAG: hypothetical protein ACTHMY_22775 [Solirubrobacteraceae bacterium]